MKKTRRDSNAFVCLLCLLSLHRTSASEPAADLCVAFESSYHIERGEKHVRVSELRCITQQQSCQCLVFESNGRSEGVISSVNYPSFYPDNVNCILLTLIGDYDELVELTFIDFSLQVPFNNRCADYVRLYLDLERPEVGERQSPNYELCGTGKHVISNGVFRFTRQHRQYYSSKRSLIVEFHSDSIQTNNTGFSAKYRFIDKGEPSTFVFTLIVGDQYENMMSVEIRIEFKFDMVGANHRFGTKCTYDFYSNRNSKSGSFYSPHYPQYYAPRSQCIYVFHGLLDQQVRIFFAHIQLGSMVTRGMDCSPAATPSVQVIVRDGVHDTATVSPMARFCNDVDNVTMTSHTSGLTVEFQSDGKDEGPGFSATYEFIYRSTATAAVTWQVPVSGLRRPDIGLVGTQTKRPNVDNQSGSKLHAGDSPFVNLESDEPHYVTPATESMKKLNNCDEQFISSSSMRNGTLTSSHYPASYPAHVNCRYTFTALREGERVQIIFTDLDLYYPTGNPKDPVERTYRRTMVGPTAIATHVRCGPCCTLSCADVDSITVSSALSDGDVESRDLNVYCGMKRPPMLMSSSSSMELLFVTGPHSENTARGFALVFKFVTDYGIRTGERDKNNATACRFIYHSVRSTNGTFTTPNFPGLYPRTTECHYLFYGRENERIFINFMYFDIEGITSNCQSKTQSDYVELSNFNVELIDRKMSRLCGSSGTTLLPLGMQSAYSSDGSFFRVTFRSNDVYDATGFEASYQFRPNTEYAERRITADGKKLAITSSLSLTSLSQVSCTRTVVYMILIIIHRFLHLNV